MRRLAFITGASSGIGQALAWRYYQAGYDLALVARRGPEMQRWAECTAACRRRAIRIYPADVADVESIVAAGQACLAQQGLPDVVVANAGISIGMDTAERADLAVLARTFAVNNVGPGRDLSSFHRTPCAGAARAGWWASPAWQASAACPATAPTAPARPG